MLSNMEDNKPGDFGCKGCKLLALRVLISMRYLVMWATVWQCLRLSISRHLSPESVLEWSKNLVLNCFTFIFFCNIITCATCASVCSAQIIVHIIYYDSTIAKSHSIMLLIALLHNCLWNEIGTSNSVLLLLWKPWKTERHRESEWEQEDL